MLQTTNRKLPTTMLIYKPKGNLRSVAIVIEVTSRRMECTLLTPDHGQVPAVTLQAILSIFYLKEAVPVSANRRIILETVD